MTQQTKPKFSDILNLLDNLPDYPQFKTSATDPMQWMVDWLNHHSRTLDLSRGFLISRCGLYWAGYDRADAFDGKAFVDACQDSNGSLNQLAAMLDADLQIFELDPTNINNPTIDELAMAASYGMMGVEENTQLFCATSFGQGVEANAQDIIANISSMKGDLETFMTVHCGLDIAAMMGVAIACIMKGIPMILDGASGKAVKMMIEKYTNKEFGNLITTSQMNAVVPNAIAGQNMMVMAMMLKTLYAALPKTDCGKIKAAA